MHPKLAKWLPLMLLVAACHRPDSAAKPDFLTANIDSTVSPAEDFFAEENQISLQPLKKFIFSSYFPFEEA